MIKIREAFTSWAAHKNSAVNSKKIWPSCVACKNLPVRTMLAQWDRPSSEDNGKPKKRVFPSKVEDQATRLTKCG